MPINTGAHSRAQDYLTSALLPLNAPFNAVKTTGEANMSKEAFNLDVSTSGGSIGKDGVGHRDVAPPPFTCVRIAGDPVPQSRPRARSVNGKVQMYEEKRSRDWKALIRQSLKEQLSEVQQGTRWITHRAYKANRLLDDGISPSWELPIYTSGVPVAVSISVSHGRKDKSHGWHIARPDIDNIAKSVLDACTGTVWEDDAQVVYLEVEQRRTTPGKANTHVTVYKADDFEKPKTLIDQHYAQISGLQLPGDIENGVLAPNE